VQKTIETEPAASIDYIAVVDRDSLQPIDKIGENEAIIAAAARFGNVRLIDNVILNRRQ